MNLQFFKIVNFSFASAPAFRDVQIKHIWLWSTGASGGGVNWLWHAHSSRQYHQIRRRFHRLLWKERYYQNWVSIVDFESDFNMKEVLHFGLVFNPLRMNWWTSTIWNEISIISVTSFVLVTWLCMYLHFFFEIHSHLEVALLLQIPHYF